MGALPVFPHSLGPLGHFFQDSPKAALRGKYAFWIHNLETNIPSLSEAINL